MYHKKISGKSVMFFLPHLGGGGAEMNVVRVSEALPKYGFVASFAVGRGGGAYEKLLEKNIKINYLNTGNIRSSRLRLIRAIKPLRELVVKNQPDVVCSVMDQPSIAAILACKTKGVKTKLVLNVQVSPYEEYIKRGGISSKVQFALVKRLYPKADHILALSKGVAEEIGDLVPEVKSRISVVNNATFARARSSDCQLGCGGEINILACGRLVEQKGYFYLLEALRKVLQSHANVILWILGDGPQRKRLEQRCRDLKISSHVKFMGFVDNPSEYMEAADIFALSSLWEGFGNVIVEAMSVGTPVVAFDCPHGPGEIITNNKDGLLVEKCNTDELANSILTLIENKKLRLNLAEQGKSRSKDFLPERIAKGYGELFRQVIS